MSLQPPDFMQEALRLAAQAAQAGEVPVGAVVVQQGQIIGRGHNRSVSGKDITAHAEIEALREASQRLGNHRLEGCELYVTLEPCVMCSGAILGARLSRVVYGASEPKTGAAGSVVDLFADARLNHHTHVEGGLLARDCSVLLQRFFQGRRQNQQSERSHNFLREDALRSEPPALPNWPQGLISAHVSDLPSLQGLRLHLLKAGEGAPTAVLGLHGPDGWSASFAHDAHTLATAGLALLAPDLPGFGLSDKPKKDSWHSLALHAAVLSELLDGIAQHRVLLAIAPAMRPLAALVALHPKVQGCFTVDLPPLAPALQDAPYPDSGHRAGPRSLPALLAGAPQDITMTHLGEGWAQALASMGY
jgi:tRNA(adenine34) deaminase